VHWNCVEEKKELAEFPKISRREKKVDSGQFKVERKEEPRPRR
jgi:hypothetical protein